MRALILFPILAGCMYTPDSRCAAAMEQATRSMQQLARESAERGADMKAVASALRGDAVANENIAKQLEEQTRQMQTWRCTPSGLPMTPVPPDAPVGVGGHS
jgi:hypothetical protein